MLHVRYQLITVMTNSVKVTSSDASVCCMYTTSVGTTTTIMTATTSVTYLGY